ncbi:MAG TPA: lipoyl(octanoyl) transferase LipB [Thermopetrobacter sp.]|nr:lipoyl(octanoyl) transferase LipB [Thermopetrobacter sp.]
MALTRRELADDLDRLRSAQAVRWEVAPGLVDYEAARRRMGEEAAAIAAGRAAELVWLLEHPPLYTAGRSARPEELLNPHGLPVHETGRGGRYTYHGPGQRVAYVMLDLRRRGRDVRAFVTGLEQWVIEALAGLGVAARRDEANVGIWVDDAARGAAKIAAIGVRVSKWVSRHGVAINVSPELAQYAGIVPCGIADGAVTSLAALGVAADMAALDAALRASFERLFSPLMET